MKSFLSRLIVLFFVVFGMQDLACNNRCYLHLPAEWFEQEIQEIPAEAFFVNFPEVSPGHPDVPRLDFSQLLDASPRSSLFDTPPLSGASSSRSDHGDESMDFTDVEDGEEGLPEDVSLLFPNLNRENIMNSRFARNHSEMSEREILEYFRRMQNHFLQRLDD